jgi:membrane-bound metal-dependent hydrolase YbcI (DUF457 family)
MNFGGHLMTGWLISNTAKFSRSERTAITLMAIAPDIDGIFVFGPVTWREWHRTFGHNIFWGILAPIITLYFIRKGRRLKLLPFLFAGMLSHFILDLFVTGWWILMPFWPLSEWGILMSRLIPETIMKYHIQLGLFTILLIFTIYIIIKQRRTPLEILGVKFDTFFRQFITMPFKERCSFCKARAFYRCIKCGASLCGKHRHFTGFFEVSCHKNNILKKQK